MFWEKWKNPNKREISQKKKFQTNNKDEQEQIDKEQTERHSKKKA